MNKLLIITEVIFPLVVSSLTNVYAAADTNKKMPSSSLTNILGFDLNAKDSTGTTLFDTAAPALISKCKESTSAQSDDPNGMSI